MTDRVGQQLGNYRLVRLLGQGGFAEVYLGEHIYLKAYAAIKVLQARFADSEIQQFLTEAQTLVRLRHPHIVKVLEFGMEGNTPYLIMDYAPNGSLRQRHPRGIPLPPNTIVPYVKQAASALHYAHEQKLVHCDIKPENMLLGHRNEILLSDFGLAVIVQSSYYQTLEMMGTVYYMAPELVQGKPRAASDQYSLAVVVYEWLCGSLPFQGTFEEVIGQHAFVPPPLLHEKVLDILPAVEEVVLIALAKDPGQRFKSVQAFANALEQASQLSQPSPVSPTSINPPPINVQLPTGILSSPPRPQQPAAPVPPSQQTSLMYQTIPEPPSSPPLPPPQSALHPVITPPISQPRRRSPAVLTALLGIAALLILGGGGLTYYFTIFQSNQLHAQATATAQAQLQRTAQVNAASTASAHTTATAHVAATATAINLTPEELYASVTSRTPVFEDPLTGSNDTNWNTYTARDGSGCGFTAGALHVTALRPDDFSVCLAPKSNYSDFAFQVQLTLLKGDANNVAGFVFRSDSFGANGYYFLLTPTGIYILDTSSGKTLGGGTSSAIQVGLNQANVFTVIARGSSIYLYANGHYLTMANDNTYHTGAIGLIAFTFTTAHLPTEAAFQNARVWML